MKSKTSCFNKAIFRKNMSRFWPVCAVYLAYLFFHMTVRMFLNTRSYITAQSADTVSPATSRLTTMLECISGNLEPYVIFFAALVAAITVFSYLFSTRSCHMIHALPVKRSELFVTNYISGFLFLLLPQLITFLLNLIVCIFKQHFLGRISAVLVTLHNWHEFSILYTCRILLYAHRSCSCRCCLLFCRTFSLYCHQIDCHTDRFFYVLWHENPWRSGQHYIDRNKRCGTFTFCVSARSCIPELVHEQ